MKLDNNDKAIQNMLASIKTINMSRLKKKNSFQKGNDKMNSIGENFRARKNCKKSNNNWYFIYLNFKLIFCNF